MSALELSQELGKTKLLTVENFQVAVRLKDGKRAYGNTRYLVEVVDGHGEAWVDSTRLQDKRDTPTA
jgi:hypothetical protein